MGKRGRVFYLSFSLLTVLKEEEEEEEGGGGGMN